MPATVGFRGLFGPGLHGITGVCGESPGSVEFEPDIEPDIDLSIDVELEIDFEVGIDLWVGC